jgi:hypothetical protein
MLGPTGRKSWPKSHKQSLQQTQGGSLKQLTPTVTENYTTQRDVTS